MHCTSKLLHLQFQCMFWVNVAIMRVCVVYVATTPLDMATGMGHKVSESTTYLSKQIEINKWYGNLNEATHLRVSKRDRQKNDETILHWTIIYVR